MFLLNEMESVILFIQSRQDEKLSPGKKKERTSQFQRSVFTMRKDEFFSEVNRYNSIYQEIQENLPFFIKVGFVHVDGREIKARLLSIC